VLLCVRRVLVSLYNPMLSFVSLMVLPLSEIYAHPSDMLAVMAEKLGGSTFRTILCIDAVTILCGGVLTSIVGTCDTCSDTKRDLLI
jgi:amino acid transporter